MIIAKIGYQNYKLKDITAAEQLLKIINESVPVDDHYFSGNTVYSTLNNVPDMKLSIVQGDLITDEELEKLNAAKLKVPDMTELRGLPTASPSEANLERWVSSNNGEND